LHIEFTTSHLDVLLYKKSILNYIYDHYHHKDYPRYMEQDDWSIYIKSLSEFNKNFYDDDVVNVNYKMAHGVTGMNEVICYLDDNPNNMIFRTNMMVVTHELAHMILKIYYPNKKGILNHNDTWAKKGSKRNYFSTEVHNRWEDNMNRTFDVNHNGMNHSFTGVDISDVVNTRNINRGI